MLTEVSPTRFIVKVKGKVVGVAQPTKQLAEAVVLGLSDDQRAFAEIVPITIEGKELLLG